LVNEELDKTQDTEDTVLDTGPVDVNDVVEDDLAATVVVR